MSPYNSSGPDGFPTLFYQQNWGVVGPKVIEMVLNFVNNGVADDGFGDALMVLIPKMIVHRLKPIMSSPIYPAQASFIPERQIIDNLVIVQEVLHSMADQSGSCRWMILKVDLAKAYNRVCWPFLREMLSRAQILPNLSNVIMHCQIKGKTEVLWNGGIAGSFDASQGIRKDDSLSPYLFVLCNSPTLLEMRLRLGRGNRSRSGVDLSHLFFVDGLILFGKTSLARA
ncbi:hypothetical protein V2J09_001382 [Rumex salicifolius]